MNKGDFRVITTEHIPAMTQLLMDRQKIESGTFSFLNNSCLNAENINELIQKLVDNKKVIGLGAFNNNEMIGYIIGEMKIDGLRGRGRHIWIPYEGVAIRNDQSPEILREIYSRAAVLWLEQGYFSHHIFVPLGECKYLDAFQRSGFFMDHVYGVMNMEDYKPFENSCDVDIRFGDKNDRDKMGNMSTIIFSALNSAPTFAPMVPEIVMDINEGYKGLVEDEDVTVLIAEKGDVELGFQVYEGVEPDLMTCDHGVELVVAGTYDSQRGKGIGKKLMNEGFRIMKEKGYKSMVTDWKITNLSASTFWPKCGFKPTVYRMVRNIDSNIAWANFDNPRLKASSNK